MRDRKLYKRVGVEETLRRDSYRISLEYYLVESNYVDEEVNSEVKTYGVELVKKEYNLDSIIKEEQKTAEHLSLDQNKVERLLEDLSRNTVTPMGLYSVLDNLIGVTY